MMRTLIMGCLLELVALGPLALVHAGHDEQTGRRSGDSTTVSASGGTVLDSSGMSERDAPRAGDVGPVHKGQSVRNARPNDEIAEDAKTALRRSPYVDHEQIRVSVVDGTVYLRGTVDSPFERLRAEYAVFAIKGLINIGNFLRVTTEWIWKPDSEIKQDIERRLRLGPMGKSQAVTVLVRGGVATLNGTVDSGQSWEDAVDRAYEGGAKSVLNNIQVLP